MIYALRTINTSSNLFRCVRGQGHFLTLFPLPVKKDRVYDLHRQNDELGDSHVHINAQAYS